MVNNIDGISGNRPPVTNPGNQSRTESSDASARAPETRTDEVNLSTSAQVLKELTDAVEASAVNSESRIEAIRQALADGTYQIDARSIADKLLSLDEQL